MKYHAYKLKSSVSLAYRFGRVYGISRRCFGMTAESLVASQYAKLPKVELHVHADGACRLSTLQDLSRKYKCPYPHDDLKAFKGVVTLPKATPSLQDFLKVFAAITDILRTKEALERVAYEFCEDISRQNVVYAEYRFAPSCSVQGSLQEHDYCEGIFAGLERGQRDFGVKVRCILCFMRDYPETVPEIIKLAEHYRTQWVVGVDIAGDELMPLHANHLEGFRRARELGLHITVHAAESGPASNVREAIDVLGAERIGHGYHVLDDEDIYAFAKERGIHFEVCPSSSVFTNANKLESHSLQVFAKDGVSFSINSDDPGVMDCDLNGEYQVAQDKIGLNRLQLMKSVLDSAQSSFLPVAEKAELVRNIKEKLSQFDPSFSPKL